jgi:tetratricopeptide (TPR) repeat protein
MDNALRYYNRAYKKAPTNATVLLCVARANHAEENYATAKKAYGELKAQDPNLAQKFAYLDLRGEEATRAADASQMGKVVIWQQ